MIIFYSSRFMPTSNPATPVLVQPAMTKAQAGVMGYQTLPNPPGSVVRIRSAAWHDHIRTGLVLDAVALLRWGIKVAHGVIFCLVVHFP